MDQLITHPVTNSTRRWNRGVLFRMGKSAASFLCRRATFHDEACSQGVRGGAYGSDSGLGKRDIDRDCGGGGGAIVGVALLVEEAPRATKAGRHGIGAWPECEQNQACFGDMRVCCRWECLPKKRSP